MDIVKLPSVFFNERPPFAIDTVVIHAMHDDSPESDELVRYSADQCKACLDRHQVSAHYLIDPSGAVFECVPPTQHAWHAGVSKMPFGNRDERGRVNNFSIGIELLGDIQKGFTTQQYGALIALIEFLAIEFPLQNIVGHDQIAPGRKQDPGPLFDWNALKTRFGGSMRML